MEENLIRPYFSQETDILIQKLFIIKSHCMLWSQLYIGTFVIFLSNYITIINDFLKSQLGISLLFISINALFIHSAILYSHYETIKKENNQYLYQTIFTLLVLYPSSTLSVLYYYEPFLIFGFTNVIILSGLILYNYQGLIDYNFLTNYKLLPLLTLVSTGLIYPFVVFNNMAIFSIVASLLFSTYVIYNTIAIVNGRLKHVHFNNEDYIISSCVSYLNIIYIFDRFFKRLK